MTKKTYLFNRRRELGLTLEDVAKKVGVTNATISRWESGEIENIKSNYIEAYAKALDTDPYFIIKGSTIPATIGEEPDELRLMLDEGELPIIAETIREKRIENNMSQEELAKALGFKNASSINLFEKGKRDVPSNIIPLMATVLHTTSHYLLTHDSTYDIKPPEESPEMESESKQVEGISRFLVELKELTGLYKQGLLTDEEFQQGKKFIFEMTK